MRLNGPVTGREELVPLRFPVTPLEDESLPGVVARATRENVLEATAIALERAGIALRQPGTVSLVPPEALESLATIIGCAPEELTNRANTYCTERWRGGPLTFGGGVVLREDLNLKTRYIAPLTLERTSNHHRSWWLLGLLPYCPLSLERLVDRCPRCPGKPLGWRRSWGIAECEWCEHLVPPSEEPGLREELIPGYRMFAHLFSIVRADRERVHEQLPATVRNLKPDTLLNIILQLGATCLPKPILLKRSSAKALPAATLATIVANGVDLLRNWPASIQSWSRVEYDRVNHDYNAVSNLRHSLRRLGLKNSAGPEQMKFVRAGLPEMFVSFDRSFADPNKIVLGHEAARITGIKLEKIQALYGAGLIKASFEHGTRRSRRQYDKAQILSLADAVRGSKAATFLTSQLGLPMYAIEQLCCLDIVQEERHAGLRFLRPELHLSSESVAHLLKTLDEGSQSSLPPEDAIVLALASRVFGGGQKPWGAIVSSILAGAVPYWLQDGPTYDRRILVRPCDLSAINPHTFDEGNWPTFEFSPHINQSDAEEILNIDTVQMGPLKTSGLLSFVRKRTSLRTDRLPVLLLAKEVVSAGELSVRTGLAIKTVLKVAKKAELPRTAFGWNRSVIDTAGLFPQSF